MNRVNLTDCFDNLDRQAKYEAYRKLWGQAAAYEVLTSFPLHLDLELSGVCNFKCGACFQNGLIEKPLGLMDYNLFTRIIDEGVGKGLCAIKLQIRGESFLHPRIFDCIRYAKDKGILDVQITTNGSLLNEETIEQVLDSGLDAIIFSVDNHHKDNLKSKKSDGEYASIEMAIDQLLLRRQERGLKYPWVRLQSSIPEVNDASLATAKKYLEERFPAADINVVSRIFNFREDVDAFPDLLVNYVLNPCTYLMHRLAVFWDGSVTVCCSDYNGRFQLGNANKQSIEEIWTSEKLQSFRDTHSIGNRRDMPICKHCVASITSANQKTIIDQSKCHLADYGQVALAS